jgi:hypothetical protein
LREKSGKSFVSMAAAYNKVKCLHFAELSFTDGTKVVVYPSSRADEVYGSNGSFFNFAVSEVHENP